MSRNVMAGLSGLLIVSGLACLSEGIIAASVFAIVVGILGAKEAILA